MARRRQAQQALLRPLRRRQTDLPATACRMAKHRFISEGNDRRGGSMNTLDREVRAANSKATPPVGGSARNALLIVLVSSVFLVAAQSRSEERRVGKEC